MRIILIILCFLNIYTLHADDGSYIEINPGKGGAVIPVKNGVIIMQKEEIVINVKPIDFYSFLIEYDCTFYFKNTITQKQTVLIGFPHNLTYVTSYSKSSPEHSPPTVEIAATDFKFIIDDKEVPFKVFPGKKNPDYPTLAAHDVVYACEVVFSGFENKKIRNTYKIIKKISDPNRELYFRGNKPILIEYILKSGATWKEPIGQADIKINFIVPGECFKIITSPKPFGIYKIPHYTIHYLYKNYIPKEDIKISFEYKPLELSQTISKIDEYIKKKEFISAYYLIKNYNDTSFYKEKSKEEKDKIRTRAYLIGNELFGNDNQKVIELYEVAFRHTYSYDINSGYPSTDELLSMDLWNWQHEGKSNAPCYYIAYNFACVYSITNQIEKAAEWLKIALRLNPVLGGGTYDKDLENLRKRKKNEYVPQELLDFKNSNFDRRRDKEFFEEIDNPNLQDSNGKTLLMILIKKYFSEKPPWDYYERIKEWKLENMKILLERDVDINMKDYEGKTAFHYAIYISSYWNEVIDILIKHGADVNARDNYGRTPLMLALDKYNVDYEIVKKLIYFSSNMNLKDNNGKTILMYLMEKYSYAYEIISICELVIKKGINIEARDNDGKTTLFYTADRSYSFFKPENITFLIKHGADVNARDNKGKTILIYSMETTYIEHKESFEQYLKILIDAGADPYIRDLRGFNAFDIAKDDEYKFELLHRLSKK
jgi:ankyrin repeat protein